MITKTYPISDPVALAAKIKAEGGPSIDPTQTSGTAETHGVHLTYVVTAGIITIAVASKPWYVSDAQISSALDGFFGKPA